MKRDLPSGAGRLADRHSKVWAAYEQLGEAVAEGGPLDAKSRRLVKLALAIGCSSEGAVHSHVRRAVSEGVKPEELRHVSEHANGDPSSIPCASPSIPSRSKRGSTQF